MRVGERVRSYSPVEIAVLTFGLTAVTAIVAGSLPIPALDPLVALVPVVGWLLLTPWAVMQSWGTEESADAGKAVDATDDPVERLRERFADGEIDEVEFERRLETLLATENTDPATARERMRERE